MKNSIYRVLAAAAFMLLGVAALAQKHNVSGTVVDASDGQPVIGAGVTLSSGGGTITDYEGKYVISASDDDVITFSSLGYVSVEQKVGGQTVIDVSLTPDTESLEEVVVLGYTTQKKAELSSSVVTVSGEKLKDVTTPDVGNMLQGKVAGVMVMNSSGQPGAGADIRIRGTGSITAGAGPLYVVDGVAGGSFNPNDVETLTVLKDASATALYGAAASGGVIVITTKSAKSEEATVNFRATAGIKKALTGRFKPMDAYEFYDYYSQVFNGKVSSTRAPKEEKLDEYNFDWMHSTYRIGVVQNYFASVSGKAGKIGYYVSLDHYNEKGTFINSGFKRNSARVNISAPITKRLNLNARINYSKSYSQEANWMTRERSQNMLPFDIPYVKEKDGTVTTEPVVIETATRPDKGTWYSENKINIFHNELYNYNDSHSESIVGDLQLIWNVTDWLTLTSTNRYDSSNSFSEDYIDPRTLQVEAHKGRIKNANSEWNSWGTTNLAKFHKAFGGHDVNAIIGWEYGQGYVRSMSVIGQGMPEGQRSLSNCPPDLILMDPDSPTRDYKTRTWALLSQAQYSYLGKYVLTASLRYDQSYKFGPLNRGGFFPGVSGAWIVSNEDFFRKQSVVNFFKVRAGFGKTGNDNIPPFQYQDTFILNSNYNGVTAAYLERQANYNLGWEEAYMTSLGFDFTIAGRLNGTIDLYHTINSNLLLDKPMSPSSGFFSVMDNVGKVRNMGIELALDGTILKMGDWRWDAGLNVGMNQNRVIYLPDNQDLPIERADVHQIIRVGQDIYSWYMPKWLGVDPKTGGPLWEELLTDEEGNLTGKTAETDVYGNAAAQIVGSASPWLTGGLNTSISWKGLTLSATGNFVVGNKIFNNTRRLLMDTDGAKLGYNQQSFDNGLGWVRWKKGDPDGTNWKATHPRPMNGGNSSAHEYSSRYLEDGSFFRLRNVTLSYDLPKNLISKIKMAGARVYVSADNLLTFTRFSGMDPEVGLELSTYSLAGLYSDNYPVPMSVVMGIDITF